MGEARRQRQVGQRAAVGGEDAVGVERLEPLQQGAGLGEGGGRRRIEEGEVGRVARAPAGEVEREAGEVGVEDLRVRR